MSEHPHPKQRHATTPRQRTWVYIFFGCAIVLFGAVIVLATGKSRIAFTWTPQPVHTSTAVNFASEPSGDDIATTIIETTVDVTKSFTAVTQTTETPVATPAFSGKARGKVVISNKWSKAQPLQAGTRLKSPDGKIFRTQQRIDIPAGGEVTTLVIADIAGEQGAEKKGTKFILPALWPGLQDDITGLADEDFYGDSAAPSKSSTPGLTANELANADKTLQEEAIDQALSKLDALIPEGRVLYPGLTFAETTKRTGPSIGDAVKTYEIKLTVHVFGFTVEPKIITELGSKLLTATLTQDVQLISLDPTTFLYSIDKYDSKAKRATGSIDIKGTTAPAPAHRLLQHATYAGKSIADVKALLDAESAVSNVNVELSPFWTRRIPASPDNLQIEVTRSQ